VDLGETLPEPLAVRKHREATDDEIVQIEDRQKRIAELWCAPRRLRALS